MVRLQVLGGGPFADGFGHFGFIATGDAIVPRLARGGFSRRAVLLVGVDVPPGTIACGGPRLPFSARSSKASSEGSDGRALRCPRAGDGLFGLQFRFVSSRVQ